MKEAIKLTLLVSALSILAGSCTRESTATAVGRTAESKAGKPPAAGKVAQIVFVDLERCCACTRKRVDAAWKALTAVVGSPPVPDVERIHMDTQAAQAAPYKKQRPIMVPPGLYFFDKSKKLVEFFQGQVDEKVIRSVLN